MSFSSAENTLYGDVNILTTFRSQCTENPPFRFLWDTRYIMLGDFNINLVQSDASVKRFLSFLSSFALCPLINKPTRICPNSSTLIDNIVTNAAESQFESGVLYADISDHLPIFCVRKKMAVPTKDCNKQTINYTRVYSDQNINSLINDLIQET